MHLADINDAAFPISCDREAAVYVYPVKNLNLAATIGNETANDHSDGIVIQP